MKTILIVNTREKECAVWQYGANLFHALVKSTRVNVVYWEPADEKDLMTDVDRVHPDAVLYNWHPSQGGFLKDAPFDVGRRVKNLCVFHELTWPKLKEIDRVLYSAHPQSQMPKTEPSGAYANWFQIPLLLPIYDPQKMYVADSTRPIIGVNGYGGAHANMVMAKVMEEFDTAIIRLHLPSAHYGDKDGRYARIFAEKCAVMADARCGIELHVNHEFMEQKDLLDWMSKNDLNLYLRPTDVAWHGVSAAMCAALAVKRAIATNRNPSFRHLWDCQPSICVEDRSLKEILVTGTKPLEPIWEENSTEKFVARMEEILGYVL